MIIKLQENEHVVQLIRRHWFVIFSESVILIILALAPLVILPFMFGAGIITATAPNIYISIFGISAWWLLLWLTFFIFWTNYYLDVWIITNFKIIDIEQHNLFRREISEYRLEKIQDVTVKITGLLATWLKFGNVEVQTAGESSLDFVIRQAPNPEMVKNMIIELQHNVVTARATVNAVIVDDETKNSTA